MTLMKVIAVVIVFGNFVTSTPIMLKAIEKVMERERRSTTEKCQVPPTIQELFTELNQHINVTQFLIAKDAAQQATALAGELNGDQIPISSTSQGCPQTVSFGFHDPIWTRSTCPWEYVSNELGSEYYPSHIPDARCRCFSCIGDTSGSNGCERIETNIRVLKKTGCRAGFYTYESELQEVGIGCTCARPRTTH